MIFDGLSAEAAYDPDHYGNNQDDKENPDTHPGLKNISDQFAACRGKQDGEKQ